MFDFIRRKRANGFSPQYRHRRDGGRTDYVGGVRMTAVLSHLAPTTALPRHAAASVPVIPAERAGLRPASESRNPVIKAVRAFTPAVDYWVPARASPVEPGSLGRDDSSKTAAFYGLKVRTIGRK